MWSWTKVSQKWTFWHTSIFTNCICWKMPHTGCIGPSLTCFVVICTWTKVSQEMDHFDTSYYLPSVCIGRNMPRQVVFNLRSNLFVVMCMWTKLSQEMDHSDTISSVTHCCIGWMMSVVGSNSLPLGKHPVSHTISCFSLLPHPQLMNQFPPTPACLKEILLYLLVSVPFILSNNFLLFT